MGIDAGFDLYPPITSTERDWISRWELFLAAVEKKFGNDPNCQISSTKIEFTVGEHPTLLRDPTRFRRFSSKVTGSRGPVAEAYLDQVTLMALQFLGSYRDSLSGRIAPWNEYEVDDSEPMYTWTEVYAAAKQTVAPNPIEGSSTSSASDKSDTGRDSSSSSIRTYIGDVHQ